MDIVVTRSHATTAVVYFSIVLTWMLFAMTAFRNALPGAPPMGAFSDYLAFFWGYAVAIVAVGVITTVWLWRRPPKDGPPAGWAAGASRSTSPTRRDAPVRGP